MVRLSNPNRNSLFRQRRESIIIIWMINATINAYIMIISIIESQLICSETCLVVDILSTH